jgi:hypothetical protein
MGMLTAYARNSRARRPLSLDARRAVLGSATWMVAVSRSSAASDVDISLPRSACETPKRSTSVAHRVAAVAGSRPLNRVGRDACDNTRGPAGGASCPTPAAPFSGLATYPVFSRCAASVAGLIQEHAAGWGRRGAPRRPQTFDQPSITSASTGIGLIASNEVAGRGRRYRFLSGGPTCSNSIILA